MLSSVISNAVVCGEYALLHLSCVELVQMIAPLIKWHLHIFKIYLFFFFLNWNVVKLQFIEICEAKEMALTNRNFEVSIDFTVYLCHYGLS